MKGPSKNVLGTLGIFYFLRGFSGKMFWNSRHLHHAGIEAPGTPADLKGTILTYRVLISSHIRCRKFKPIALQSSLTRVALRFTFQIHVPTNFGGFYFDEFSKPLLQSSPPHRQVKAPPHDRRLRSEETSWRKAI